MTPTPAKRELTIVLDVNGNWRRYRFEFCNLLEALAAASAPPAKLWAELKRFGVTAIRAEEAGETKT